MQVHHDQFIAVYKDVYPEGYCQHLISEFERLEKEGAGSNRQNGEGALKHIKDDYHVFLNIRNHSIVTFNNRDSVDIFFDGLQRCYEEYTSVYSILKSNGTIRGTALKLQRTCAGGGYHIWHCEQGAGSENRVLVYALYLNTLPESSNGETEFLYQQRRFKPEENTMLLFPATYTHPHRGNPVYGDTAKYIATGWFYYD